MADIDYEIKSDLPWYLAMMQTGNFKTIVFFRALAQDIEKGMNGSPVPIYNMLMRNQEGEGLCVMSTMLGACEPMFLNLSNVLFFSPCLPPAAAMLTKMIDDSFKKVHLATTMEAEAEKKRSGLKLLT